MRNRIFLPAALLASGLVFACQAYNMEAVDPQTVVAVETYGTFTKGKPPTLLIVQDRSGSMDICFDQEEVQGAGLVCNLADGTSVQDRRSRMVVAREVMDKTVSANQDEVWFGLVAYGVPDPTDVNDPTRSCGPPAPLVDPSGTSSAQVIASYREDELLVVPAGGTPTTRALRMAYERLVDQDGKLRHGDRDNFVVLVTDGLMNCDNDHPMPCLCSQEEGCLDTDTGTQVALGEEGTFITGQLCLDDASSLAEVRRLREANVKTFVIGLGDTFTGGDPLSSRVLDELAEEGGVPRVDHAQKFYSAADEAELEAALAEIIKQISAPCAHKLDGPVCDGRLVKVALKIDGQDVETTCDGDLQGEADWFFVAKDGGGLNEQEITFSPSLCTRMAEAEKVEISIRGVENACPDEDTEPACSLAK